MKSCIFLLTLLGFVRLCFASGSSKVSVTAVTDNSDYVYSSNVFRRKRADGDYTRWNPSLETTPQFLVKVLDEDLSMSSKPVVAVNIMPMAKNGDMREKIIVGGAIIPPRQTLTTVESMTVDPRDYTRFVPPIVTRTKQPGERLEPTVYVAPVKLSGVKREPLLSPVQMQFAPQPQHELRDESPPAGPQFIPRSQDDLKLARQYAPIVPVVFQRKSFTPFSRTGPTRTMHTQYAHKHLPITHTRMMPTRKSNDVAHVIPEDFIPTRIPGKSPLRTRQTVVPTRTRATAPDGEELEEDSRDLVTVTASQEPTANTEHYNVFNYDSAEISSTSKTKEEEIVFYSDNNRRNIEENSAFYDDDREDGGGGGGGGGGSGGGGGGGGGGSFIADDYKFRNEFISNMPKFDLVDPEMYDSGHQIVSRQNITVDDFSQDPLNLTISEETTISTNTVHLKTSTDEILIDRKSIYVKSIDDKSIDENSIHENNSTTEIYEETIPEISEETIPKLEPKKNVCSMIKLRNLDVISPRTLPEITAQLKKWAEDSPMARWVDITDGNLTVMENPIHMMIVDDPRNGQFVDAKLTVVIVAGIQGRDHHAVAAAMYILYQLIERSESHTELLSRYRFWIIPVFNPDGYDYSMTFPKRRQWTKNLRQDWDDCNGRESCKACVARGVRCTVQPCYGVNLDRNFEYQWIPSAQLKADNPCGATYAGIRQLSEVETRSLTGYLENQRPPIYVFLAFKEGDVLGVMYPYSHTKKKRAFDETYRQRASKAAAAAQSINGRPYVAGQTSEFLPLYAGGIEDWVDGHLSIDNTYTIAMYRPLDRKKSPAITESAIHEAYAAMDTLLIMSTKHSAGIKVKHDRKSSKPQEHSKKRKFRANGGPRTQPSYVTILLASLLLHFLSKFIVFRLFMLSVC